MSTLFFILFYFSCLFGFLFTFLGFKLSRDKKLSCSSFSKYDGGIFPSSKVRVISIWKKNLCEEHVLKIKKKGKESKWCLVSYLDSFFYLFLFADEWITKSCLALCFRKTTPQMSLSWKRWKSVLSVLQLSLFPSPENVRNTLSWKI